MVLPGRWSNIKCFTSTWKTLRHFHFLRISSKWESMPDPKTLNRHDLGLLQRGVFHLPLLILSVGAGLSQRSTASLGLLSLIKVDPREGQSSRDPSSDRGPYRNDRLSVTQMRPSLFQAKPA